LVILLVISCAVIAYFIYETRIKSPNTQEPKPETSQTTNDQNDSIQSVSSYEDVKDDHMTYTAPKRPAPGEPSDDHVYASLNQEPNNVERNQGETMF
jgi:hypothetical protein